MRKITQLFLILSLLSLPIAAQIPSGYVQTIATVPSLANGTFGAAWTNLSSSPQLALLGCVSTFQQTVNGAIDGSGHFSTLLADVAQICPSPSTWTFTLTFLCATPPNTAFMVQVPVTGGGGTQDISSQITAALPTNPCSGGGGGAVTKIIAGANVTISPVGGTGAVTINSSGGGGSSPSAPAYSVQVANASSSALVSDSLITIVPGTHTLVVGVAPTYKANIGALGTMAASWNFDTTTPLTGINSLTGSGTTNYVWSWNGSSGGWAAPTSAPGVTSLNSLTGGLSIAAGSGITVTPSGSTITIAAPTGFTSGTASSGAWVKDPTGTITQRGCVADLGTGDYTLTFPVTFTTTVNLSFVPAAFFPSGYGVYVVPVRGSLTTTQVTVHQAELNDLGMCWVAVGN